MRTIGRIAPAPNCKRTLSRSTQAKRQNSPTCNRSSSRKPWSRRTAANHPRMSQRSTTSSMWTSLISIWRTQLIILRSRSTLSGRRVSSRSSLLCKQWGNRRVSSGDTLTTLVTKQSTQSSSSKNVAPTAYQPNSLTNRSQKPRAPYWIRPCRAPHTK